MLETTTRPIRIEDLLPIRRYIQVAIDYANLDSPWHQKLFGRVDPPSIEPLCAEWDMGLRRVAATVRAELPPRQLRRVTLPGGKPYDLTIDFGYRHPVAFNQAKIENRHRWVRDLMTKATSGSPIADEDRAALLSEFRAHKVGLKIDHGADGFSPSVEIPKADLFWFVCVGVISLLAEPRGLQLVRCANFDGPESKRVMYRACSCFVLKEKISDKYCSLACRTAVAKRATTIAQRISRKQNLKTKKGNRK